MPDRVTSTVSFPSEAIIVGPTIMWNHIDGPLLQWAGHMHWLTWRECFAMFFGREDEESIARKRWPHLGRLADQGRAALQSVTKP